MSAASLISNITKQMVTDHPYYPLEVEIFSYLANEWSTPVLLASFAGVFGTVLLLALSWAHLNNPRLSSLEKTTIGWFVLSGTIHLFFEGYFCWNHKAMGPKQDLFGQLWKEYSLSDSRYLTSDPFVLCMETITAVLWGPGCYLTALFIATAHPLRHPFQLIVSSGQLYGCVLYYATSMFDHYYKGVAYSRPEFLYFWVYYFGMNFFWSVIPSCLINQSVQRIRKGMEVLARVEGGKKTQ